VTRYNLPPADDPASVESFLRVRRSQLDGGRPPMIRGTREAAERRSTQHDAERVMDLLRRMPPEEYATAADVGPEALEAAQYDWLRRHGLERGRVDAALGALRVDLDRRVHPPVDPAVTAGAAARAAFPERPLAAPAVAHLTAADRRGDARQRGRRAGRRPRSRPAVPGVARSAAREQGAGPPDSSPGTPGESIFQPNSGATTRRAIRRAPGGSGRRSW
jgi:hypothetical protein